MKQVVLKPLLLEEREDFIRHNQASFKKAVLEVDENFQGEISQLLLKTV